MCDASEVRQQLALDHLAEILHHNIRQTGPDMGDVRIDAHVTCCGFNVHAIVVH